MKYLNRAVAIAYVMQKIPYVFPIVGGRKVEHLHANLEALDIALTAEHIRKIEGAVPFDAGFPYNMIVSEHVLLVKPAEYPLTGSPPRAMELITALDSPVLADMTYGLSVRPFAPASRLRRFRRLC